MESFVFDNNQVIRMPIDAHELLAGELLSGYTQGNNWNIRCDLRGFCITIGHYTKVELSDYEYVMNITTDGVYICGSDFSAAMHGFVTMLEKLRYSKECDCFMLDCDTISESAKIPFRCVHLCIFPETKLDFLKKCVRACGIAKYSHIIMEFWGMLKFDCMKELSWPFAYSKEQVKDIVREANALGMEVIPMFNHLGHASACREIHGKHVVLDQNPKYEYMFNSHGWIWNIQNNEVCDLLRKIRRELINLCGNGSYFHLGFDEAYSLGGDSDMAEKLCQYLNEIQKELESEGRRAIIWGDMLLDKAAFQDEKQHYFAYSEKCVANTIRKNLNKSIIIADWQYLITDDTWKSSEILKDEGFDVICCPWDNHSKVSNVDTAIKTARSNELYGIMHTTWNTLHVGFPVMVYSGVASWYGNTDSLNEKEFRFHSAAIARKVLPAKGAYERAGWSEKSTGPGL